MFTNHQANNSTNCCNLHAVEGSEDRKVFPNSTTTKVSSTSTSQQRRAISY